MPTARRRPSNLLALAVLGVLAQRPMHPYEIATTLRDYGKDSSIKVKWGSLYTVVATLEKGGLISATGTDRQGGRPERTIYGLTPEGREELGDWLRELLSVPDREYPRFEAALSLIAIVPPEEAASLLDSRLRRLEGEIVAQRAALEHYAKGLPRLFLIEAEFHVALLEAEATWVRQVVDQLTTGTFPDQAAWRRFHETGEVPTDFSDWEVGGGSAVPDRTGEEAPGTSP
jgi:DNA-binding PadR family transcriptional regulator